MNTKAIRFLKRNSATILTCIGSGGVFITAFLAVKATPKALKLINKAEKEKGNALTVWETFKTVNKVYVPSILTGIGTTVCIFGANALSKHQQVAIMSAYALINNSYKEYKDKLKEICGEETHQDIINALAVEKAEETHITSECLCNTCNLSLADYSGDLQLFYDEYTNRYFEATIEQVISAEYHLNRNYVLRGYALLNEFYEFLGLESTDYGSEVGWAVDDDCLFWIDFNHRKATIDNDLECYIIEMPFEPSLKWKEYY